MKFKVLAAIGLCSAMLLGTTHANETRPNPYEGLPVAEVAEWMTQQSRAETRAAGLLVLAVEEPGHPTVSGEALPSEVREMLSANPDQAVLSMLAYACAHRDLVPACIEAGLEDSIVGSGGNLLSLAALSGAEGIGEAIVSAQTVAEPIAHFAAEWLAALQGRWAGSVPEGQELVVSLSLASAVAWPSWSSISRSCAQAVEEDATLDAACRRLSADMRESGDTLLVRSIGYAMARSRAEALGEKEQGAEYEARNQAMMREGAELARHAEAELLADRAVQRDFLERWKNDGELAAFRYLAEQ